MTTISPEQMAIYRENARRRREAAQLQLRERFEYAWRMARQAAELLQSRFGATRVVAFGSLVDQSLFHAHSDLDLAVWGIPESLYLRAWADAYAVTEEFEIDLIRVEEAPPSLLARIQKEGVVL